MTWWGWMLLGVLLFGAELFAVEAQFYLVFLGISAIIVGGASVIGITMPEWVQWTTFAVLALISMFTFRKSLYQKMHGNIPGFKAPLTGEKIDIIDDLAPGDEARVELRGTKWTIKNAGSVTIESGSSAKVIKTVGLVLHVSTDL